MQGEVEASRRENFKKLTMERVHQVATDVASRRSKEVSFGGEGGEGGRHEGEEKGVKEGRGQT